MTNMDEGRKKRTVSPEARQKQSEVSKQRWHAGEMEAQRAGLLKANTGRKLSAEHLEKFHSARRAKGCGPETREKLRRNKLGTVQSAETIAKRKATVAANGGPKPLSEATRAKIRASKVDTVVQPSVRARISETLKAAAAQDPEGIRQHWLDIIAAKPELQKGPQNRGAVDAIFRSPDGRTFKCRNITHFVRMNPGLFAEEDVVWRGKTCRAAHGLRRLRSAHYGATEAIRNAARKSWKGWTLKE